MKRFCAVFCFVLLVSESAWADMQTVELFIPGMSRADCPITIEEILRRVDGVSDTEVSAGKRLAVITFDDGKTTVDDLIRTVEEVGYSSSVMFYTGSDPEPRQP